MENEKIIEIDLYNYFKMNKENVGGLLHGKIYTDKERPLILIIPGGAYMSLCYRENVPFQKKFFELGYNAFYLDYSCDENTEYLTSLKEVVMAITYIRKNYKGKLAIIGFSAGGHLVGQSVNDNFNVDFLGNDKSHFILPDATIYCYPVISSRADLMHEGSFRNLLKDKFCELKEKVSIENMVNEKSSPAFIFHCVDDKIVPVGNSIQLANAYLKNGVPVELHIFPRGGHGVALPTLECFTEEELKNVNINKDLTIWFDLCLSWLKNLKI